MTWYNLASDQYTGLNGVVVPGTLRDSLLLLAVVLEQETALQPTEIMTDTGAYADGMFGIFHLLGYRFSPRIADAGGARFWRMDRHANYGPLDDLAAHRINLRLIEQHWDDLLRLAGSLKLGVVQAMGLVRTLQVKDRPTPLARALAELGRVVKTLHLSVTWNQTPLCWRGDGARTAARGTLAGLGCLPAGACVAPHAREPRAGRQDHRCLWSWARGVPVGA